MTGWERLEPMIGSIELLERPAQDDNHVTEAWLCVQIVAIAEAIKTSSDLSEVFALTELLTKRWESFRKFADGSNEVDIVLLRSEIKRNMQKKAGAALHVDTNLIKQLAWRLFEANSTSDHVLSGKELLALLTSQDAIQKVYQSQDKAHVVAFEAENSESVTFKEKISGRYISIAKSTLNNWRTRFAKRLQHDDLK